MELYKYLIGGKKTGQMEDLKDSMPDSKPFYDLKEGETFFISFFKPDGTCRQRWEIKISSIHKNPTYWAFIGFGKKGAKYAYPARMEDLDKKLVVEDRRTYYRVYSTFKMDDKPFFGLVKKEIKNSKK